MVSDGRMGAADPYAEIPELYDLEHADFADGVAFYQQFAEVIGDPILELGCGTGRLLQPLAAAGHRVTGIDQSAPMLARAHEHLAGGPCLHGVDRSAPRAAAQRMAPERAGRLDTVAYRPDGGQRIRLPLYLYCATSKR